ELALGEVVRRHEVLRTRFEEVDGSPVQVIGPAGEFRLALEDLSALDDGTRAAALRRRAAELAGQPFDLEVGPLVRVAALGLAADRARPAVQSFRGAAHGFVLSEALTEGLRRLARREEATLFMVLLAAFQVGLARWSNQTDVVVGSPVAGRTDRQTEGL